LFEDIPYAQISKTSQELAYQLYLLDLILHECTLQLAEQTRYIDELASYGRLALFSMCVKALKVKGA
jgi:hypothetical protein